MKLNLNYRIGMRAFKTSLAVIIGLYLSNILHLNTPVFTTIACITSMKPSMSEAFADIKRRAFTSVFGVILGYVLGLIPATPMVEPLIAGFGILIVIWILIVFNMKNMTTLSCIVFVASFASVTDATTYALNRVVGTFLGIAVGVLINFMISSPNVEENFMRAATKTYKTGLSTLREIVVHQGTDLEAFNKSYSETMGFYQLLVTEVEAPLHHDIDLKNSKRIIQLLDHISVRLALISTMKNTHLEPFHIEDLSRRFQLSLFEDGTNLNKVDDVFNYHIKYLLNYFDELREILKVNQWTNI